MGSSSRPNLRLSPGLWIRLNGYDLDISWTLCRYSIKVTFTNEKTIYLIKELWEKSITYNGFEIVFYHELPIRKLCFIIIYFSPLLYWRKECLSWNPMFLHERYSFLQYIWFRFLQEEHSFLLKVRPTNLQTHIDKLCIEIQRRVVDGKKWFVKFHDKVNVSVQIIGNWLGTWPGTRGSASPPWRGNRASCARPSPPPVLLVTRFISHWQLDINFHGTSTKTFPFLVFTFISSSRTLVRVIVMELINHFTGRRMKSFILLPVIKLYWDIRHFSIAKQIIKLKRHKELVNFNSFFLISNLVNINGTTLVGDNLEQESLWWVAALVWQGLVRGNRGTIQGAVDDLLITIVFETRVMPGEVTLIIICPSHPIGTSGIGGCCRPQSSGRFELRPFRKFTSIVFSISSHPGMLSSTQVHFNWMDQTFAYRKKTSMLVFFMFILY